MESGSSTSTDISPVVRGNNTAATHSGEVTFDPPRSTASSTAAMSSDDVARLDGLHLNEDRHSNSNPSVNLPRGEVSLKTQNSIFDYFTPTSLSPVPSSFFPDTPVTVNHPSPKPRPLQAREHVSQREHSVSTTKRIPIDIIYDPKDVVINENMRNLSPDTLAKRLSVGLQEYAASILSTAHRDDDIITSRKSTTPTTGNYDDNETITSTMNPITQSSDDFVGSETSDIQLAPYKLTAKKDNELKTYEVNHKNRKGPPRHADLNATTTRKVPPPHMVGINNITPPPSSENLRINFHYGEAQNHTNRPGSPTNMTTTNRFASSPQDFPSMSTHSTPAPKPQRTARPIRTRRERMAAASPPPALYDPDLTKYETALKNIRSFEEALFWANDTQSNYSPDPNLYPDTSASKLWLSDSQSTDHAKRSYLSKKLDQLTVSHTHTVNIDPTQINDHVQTNPAQAKQHSIRSYMVNKSLAKEHVPQQSTNLNPQPSISNDEHNVPPGTDKILSPKCTPNTSNPPMGVSPLTVTFSVNEETDNHTRSAFIPQVVRETTPSFIATDPTEGTPTQNNAAPVNIYETLNHPLPTTTILGQSTQPENQANAQKQSYFAEILPDALEVWKSYRNASQREGACRIKAGYMRYLARSGRFPAWTSTMMPPPGMVSTMDASLRVVAHRRQQATSSLNLMASILEDKAINHKTNVDLYREGLRQRYSDYTPYPGSTIDYNYQTALNVAKSLVDRDHADLNKKLNAEAAVLKANPENALWAGIEYKFRPRNLIPGQPDINTQPQSASQNQPIPAPGTLRGNNLTQVSPLMSVDRTNNPLAPNPIFQTAWGQMGRRQTRGMNVGRRRPYNQSPNIGRPYQDPQNHQYESTGYNQGQYYQNPGNRRRGRRDYQPQSRDNRQDNNRESDLMNMLKKLVENF